MLPAGFQTLGGWYNLGRRRRVKLATTAPMSIPNLGHIPAIETKQATSPTCVKTSNLTLDNNVKLKQITINISLA